MAIYIVYGDIVKKLLCVVITISLLLIPTYIPAKEISYIDQQVRQFKSILAGKPEWEVTLDGHKYMIEYKEKSKVLTFSESCEGLWLKVYYFEKTGQFSWEGYVEDRMLPFQSISKQRGSALMDMFLDRLEEKGLAAPLMEI